MPFPADRDLNHLNPVFGQKVTKLLSLCDGNKIPIIITEGNRSKARQFWLWCKGRIVKKSDEIAFLGYDSPEIDSAPKEKAVTWTLRSNHLTGRAVDFCFRTPQGGASYNGDWDKVYDLAEICGMESLFRKAGLDRPHLQDAGLYKAK